MAKSKELLPFWLGKWREGEMVTWKNRQGRGRRGVYALPDKNEKWLKKTVGRIQKEREETVGDRCMDRTGKAGIRMDLFEKQTQKGG
jgi:hypothetical protein